VAAELNHNIFTFLQQGLVLQIVTHVETLILADANVLSIFQLRTVLLKLSNPPCSMNIVFGYSLLITL